MWNLKINAQQRMTFFIKKSSKNIKLMMGFVIFGLLFKWINKVIQMFILFCIHLLGYSYFLLCLTTSLVFIMMSIVFFSPSNFVVLNNHLRVHYVVFAFLLCCHGLHRGAHHVLFAFLFWCLKIFPCFPLLSSPKQYLPNLTNNYKTCNLGV